VHQNLDAHDPSGSHKPSRTALVARVLEGRWRDRDEALALGCAAGVDLGVPWGLVLIVPTDVRRSPQPVADALESAFEEVVVGRSVPLPVPHLPVLARPRDEEGWAAAVQHMAAPAWAERVVVAHAEPCDLLGPKAGGRQRAESLLGYARVARRFGAVVPLEEAAHLAFLAAAPVEKRMAFARGALGRLMAEPALFATLEATYEADDAAIDRVAACMQCHRNTVRRRWTRIRELTGLDLAVPVQRHRLFDALLVRRGLQAELGELD
jgi:cytochrome c553